MKIKSSSNSSRRVTINKTQIGFCEITNEPTKLKDVVQRYRDYAGREKALGNEPIPFPKWREENIHIMQPAEEKYIQDRVSPIDTIEHEAMKLHNKRVRDTINNVSDQFLIDELWKRLNPNLSPDEWLHYIMDVGSNSVSLRKNKYIQAMLRGENVIVLLFDIYKTIFSDIVLHCNNIGYFVSVHAVVDKNIEPEGHWQTITGVHRFPQDALAEGLDSTWTADAIRNKLPPYMVYDTYMTANTDLLSVPTTQHVGMDNTEFERSTNQDIKEIKQVLDLKETTIPLINPSQKKETEIRETTTSVSEAMIKALKTKRRKLEIKLDTAKSNGNRDLVLLTEDEIDEINTELDEIRVVGIQEIPESVVKARVKEIKTEIQNDNVPTKPIERFIDAEQLPNYVNKTVVADRFNITPQTNNNRSVTGTYKGQILQGMGETLRHAIETTVNGKTKLIAVKEGTIKTTD